MIGFVHIDLPEEVSGDTCLIAAADQGHLPIVRLLLFVNASTSAINKSGFSALGYALSRGHFHIGSLLVDRGASVNIRFGRTRESCLILGSYNAPIALLEKLMDSGCDLNHQDVLGRTALMIAAQIGRVELVRSLLRRGAQKDLKDLWGSTAAELASMMGQDDVLDMLLV